MNKMTEVIEMDQPAQAPQRAVAAQQQTAMSSVGPADLLRYALDSGADLDRLERLMDMQDRDNANKARMAFVSAMAEFKKHAPTIYKDKDVSFTGTSYSHATLGGICEVVIESLAQHGISHRWDMAQPSSGLIVIKCILTHIMGHSETTTMEAPPDNSGKKNGIQQIASAMTYLQRYTLLAATGLSTKDMPDDDGRGSQEAKPAAPVVRRPIGGKGLDAAIASIKAGEYTVARLTADYILTEDQITKVNDEAGNA